LFGALCLWVIPAVYAQGKLVWSISESEDGVVTIEEPENVDAVLSGPSEMEKMILERMKSLSSGLAKMPAPPQMKNKEIDIPLFDLKRKSETESQKPI